MEIAHINKAVLDPRLWLIDELTDDSLPELETRLSDPSDTLCELATGFVDLSFEGIDRFANITKQLSEKLAGSTLKAQTLNHLLEEQIARLGSAWGSFVELLKERKIKASHAVYESLLDSIDPKTISSYLLAIIFNHDSEIDFKFNLLKGISNSTYFTKELYANLAHWAFYRTELPQHFELARKLYKKVLGTQISISDPREYYILRNYLLAHPLTYTNKNYLLKLARLSKQLSPFHEMDPLGLEFCGDINLCLNEIDNNEKYRRKAADYYQEALKIVKAYPRVDLHDIEPLLCWQIIAYPYPEKNIQEKYDYVLNKKIAYGVILHKSRNWVSLNFSKPDPNSDFASASGCSGCGGCGCGCSSASTLLEKVRGSFFSARRLSELLEPAHHADGFR